MKPLKIKNTKPFRMSLGDRGEMAAWSFMKNEGYGILERNFRCALGEIDVVAERDGRLSFVEIKTRTSERFGRPEEAVNLQKQKKIIQVAEYYLKKNNLNGCPVSFDVIAVAWKKDADPEFRLYKDAFIPESDGL